MVMIGIDPHKGTHTAVAGTTLTDIFGVRDVVAATLIGHTGDIDRFPTADRFAVYKRHGPHRMVLGEPQAAHPPAVPAREQGHEPCPARRRGIPAPPLPQPGPSLL